MSALRGLAVLLADVDWDASGHMDGGWWIAMVIGMVLFWGLVVLGVVWLVRELAGSREGRRVEPDALALLDRRLADGTISPDEYRERRAILTESSPPATGG